MDNFAVHLSTTDTKKKLSIGQDIIDYLGQPENPTDCEDLGGFIDALVPWMQSSNFKVWKNWNNFVNLISCSATKNSYAFFTILVSAWFGCFFKSLKITLKAIPLQIFVNTHYFFQMCFKCLCHTKCFQIYVTCHEDCHYFITYDTWRIFAHQLFTNT